jgi:hypothetical protein
MAVDCTPLAGSLPPLTGRLETPRIPLRNLHKEGRDAMAAMNRWLIPMAVLGAAATGVAVTLMWLLLTRPVMLAQALTGGGF